MKQFGKINNYIRKCKKKKIQRARCHFKVNYAKGLATCPEYEASEMCSMEETAEIHL